MIGHDRHRAVPALLSRPAGRDRLHLPIFVDDLGHHVAGPLDAQIRMVAPDALIPGLSFGFYPTWLLK